MMIYNDSFYKVWLAIIDIPNNVKVFLKNKFINEKALYEFYKEFRSLDIKEEYSNRIINTKDDEVIKLLERLEKDKIKAIFFGDENYIEELNNLHQPPYVIFYKGDLSKINNHRKVSIVGSRKATHYGIQITDKISRELVANDVMVVSGGAFGIDTAAHKGALSGNGTTCAVLGCGLNVTYPKSNKKLFDDISERGVLMSEFLPNEKPLSHNFPRRNRIISALCEVLIVAEAAEQSGSLITAGHALDLGKTVFAVPGNPLMHTSKGSNQLIRDGATIFTDIKDIFHQMSMENKKSNSRNFSGDKGTVLKEIGSNPIHINDLIRICNIDINVIYGILFELQLENEIISLTGNYFARIS